jgi:hypothetical protein
METAGLVSEGHVMLTSTAPTWPASQQASRTVVDKDECREKHRVGVRTTHDVQGKAELDECLRLQAQPS